MFSLLSFCVYSVKTTPAEQVLLLLDFTPITNFKYRMEKHAILFINIRARSFGYIPEKEYILEYIPAILLLGGE